MKILVAAATIATLILAPPSREIATVDLTHPVDDSDYFHNRWTQLLPAECPAVSWLHPTGSGSGGARPQDGPPRHIKVEIIHVSETSPALWTEVEAQVRLENIDTRPVEIPWSADRNVVAVGQSRPAFSWIQGSFLFSVTDENNDRIYLKSSSGSLFSTDFFSGSRLTIQPGEAVTAVVTFKLEVEFAAEDVTLKEGNWRLEADWLESEEKDSITDCSPHFETRDRTAFYSQTNPQTQIKLVDLGPLAGQKPED